MSRRTLCLLSLLFVVDAMVVSGRGPRPVVLSGKEVLDVVRITGLQGSAII